MNKKILIFSLVIFLGLLLAIYQYAKEFQVEFARAVSTKPANGHLWSEMECNAGGLCVAGIDNDQKVGIGTNTPTQKLEVNGSILATGTGDVCNGTGKCLNSVFQTNAIAGTNQACPEGQTAIMKANNGIWYTATATQVSSSWSQVACGKVMTADGTPLLMVGNHTNKQCVDAGGTVVPAAGSDNQCRFQASSCPSGWTNSTWCTVPSTVCNTYCCGTVLCPWIGCSFGSSWSTPCGATSCSWPAGSYGSCSVGTSIWVNAGSCSAAISQIGCY